MTLLVHSDTAAPMVDYSMASSTLHVRSDCSPACLLNYVQSDRCLNAGDEAQEMLMDDKEEQWILEKARAALGAKQVIRVCSVYDRQQVSPCTAPITVSGNAYHELGLLQCSAV